MYPIKTTVEGMPRLNFPDVCTDEPMFGKAFCMYHCTTTESKDIPTDLKKYLQFLGKVLMVVNVAYIHKLYIVLGLAYFHRFCRIPVT